VAIELYPIVSLDRPIRKKLVPYARASFWIVRLTLLVVVAAYAVLFNVSDQLAFVAGLAGPAILQRLISRGFDLTGAA
jgi:hypothetical protein